MRVAQSKYPTSSLSLPPVALIKSGGVLCFSLALQLDLWCDGSLVFRNLLDKTLGAVSISVSVSSAHYTVRIPQNALRSNSSDSHWWKWAAVGNFCPSDSGNGNGERDSKLSQKGATTTTEAAARRKDCQEHATVAHLGADSRHMGHCDCEWVWECSALSEWPIQISFLCFSSFPPFFPKCHAKLLRHFALRKKGKSIEMYFHGVFTRGLEENYINIFLWWIH